MKSLNQFLEAVEKVVEAGQQHITPLTLEHLKSLEKTLHSDINQSLLGNSKQLVSQDNIESIFEILHKISDWGHLQAPYVEDTFFHIFFKSLTYVWDLCIFHQKDAASFYRIHQEDRRKYQERLNKFINKVEKAHAEERDWSLYYYLTYSQQLLDGISQLDIPQYIKSLVGISCQRDHAAAYQIFKEIFKRINSGWIADAWYIRQLSLLAQEDASYLPRLQEFIGVKHRSSHFVVMYAAQEALLSVLMKHSDPAVQEKILGGHNIAGEEKALPTLHYFCGEDAARKTRADCRLFGKKSAVFRHGVEFFLGISPCRCEN